MDKNKKKEIMVVVIDASALKDFFEGKNKGKSKELMKLIKELKEKGSDMKIITPISSFLRAIWLSDPNVKINNIQKTLSFLEVHPCIIDFKVKDKVQNEIIHLAKRLGKICEEARRLKDE